MKCCKLCIVSGRVQGVFYRHETQQKAKELGLTGWVRNMPNGDVECVICGDEKDIEAMCIWLWEGPPAAKVENVHTNEVPWEEYAVFEVKR